MSEARRLQLLLASLAIAAACASMGMPPGGPPDHAPPLLLKVTPDSGTLRVGARQVVTFRFDEVVSERTRAGTGLEQAVVVSPSDGAISVDWHRSSITIRNRKGWRPDLAYTVTIMAGLMDLSGNATKKPLQTVFSTGTVIPEGVVSGVAFDWAAQRVASGARVEAMIGNDTVLKFVTIVDTLGKFVLTTLPPGPLKLRAYLDANSNHTLDPRELWDSASVALTDTASREFYMFAHDSIGPSLSDVTPIDTLTLRVRFDRPVLPGSPLAVTQFSLKIRDTTKTDSVAIPLLRLSPAARFDSLAQVHKLFAVDSTMRADTSVSGKKAVARKDSLARMAKQDSISRAQVASVAAARDTTKRAIPPAKPTRAAPITEYILELGRRLPYDVFATLSVSDVVGLTGHIHKPPRVKQVVIRKPPPPPDTSAVKVKKP